MQQLRLQNEQLRAQSGHSDSRLEQRQQRNTAEAVQPQIEVQHLGGPKPPLQRPTFHQERETRHSSPLARHPDYDLEEEMNVVIVQSQAGVGQSVVILQGAMSVPESAIHQNGLSPLTRADTFHLNILAYAAHCQTDALGRPVAGVVVICRERLKGETFSHQAAVQTVIHELFHVLGFSKELFHTWRDCSSMSQAEGADCSPQGKVTYSDGSGHMRIYTPSVISALQKHLNSTDPELGGWLENLGVLPGKVSSHWESRVFQGSIMAAELADSSSVRIDPVTLAALQDTGWYNVDVSRAQSLVWGDGEGAMFGSLSTCQNKSSPFFCSGSGFGCHYLHLHKGECKTDQYLEGCRVYKPLKNGSECWKKENPRRSAEEDSTGEIFGFDSRCFFSSLTRQVCTPYRRSYCCPTGPNRYQIHVSGSEWVECPAGGSIQIEGYQGSVSCPDRRLCLYSDITPPSDAVDTFPASVTRDPYGTLTSAQTWTSLSFGVKTSLGITAAVCLLAAVLVSYRKCSCRIRIHTSTDEHSNL
ncbi:ciliated left-right organizer metallopeptidase-like [Labrus mixtus]|uniref:ciliated left-right organizer metallopeptidase-like n=1 Tax=Labrus mixtus TaxID=508554 RepID=UPI0029C08743|nr:ciliated left-right organizer metallopeptidase-like [Labrus mixtus]